MHLRFQARIWSHMTARKALNPYDNGITSDQNFSLRWHFFSNYKLKETLKQKDEEINQKDEELNLERLLWKSRESGWNPSTGTDLHRIEVFDGVISDESGLHSATLQQGGVQVCFGACRDVRDCFR